MKTKILLFLAVSSLISNTRAREAMYNDFPYIIGDSQTDIVLKDNGSSEIVSSITFTVIKDEAKNQLSLYKFQFDSNEQDYKILEAYVKNGDVKIPVDEKNIQRSAVASKEKGIINNTEIAIPFSQIKKDSSVFMKFKLTNKPGAFGKFWSQNSYWGDKLPEKGSLTIKSPKEIFYKIKDDLHVMTVNKAKEKDGKYTLNASIRFAPIRIPIGEIGVVSKNSHTMLTLSTEEKWGELRKIVSSKYEPSLKEKLPPELLHFIKAIPVNLKVSEKIDMVLGYITSHYDYLGDWRDKGKFVPKSISKIVADKFGDCKDYSMLLTMMLRELKIKADLALVERSYDPLDLTEASLPSLDYFNHMIVRVADAGNVYWVDATNNYSVGTENRVDISSRAAFVLNDDPDVIQYTKKVDPERRKMLIKKVYTFLNKEEAEVSGNFEMQGETARILEDSYKDKGKNDFDEAIKSVISQGEKAVFKEYTESNFKPHSYYDVNSKFSYKGIDLSKMNDKSKNSSLTVPDVKFLSIFTMTQTTDIGSVNVEMVPDVENEYYYKNVFSLGKIPNGCDITSDWMDARRRYELANDGIVVRDLIKIKKNVLTPKDFSDEGFSSIASEASRCFSANVIEFDFGTKKHIDRKSTFEASIAKLTKEQKISKRRDIASEVMDSRSSVRPDGLVYDDAKAFLDQNLIDNPNDSETLRQMATYYKDNALIIGDKFEANSMKRALEYADKAIAADENNKMALLEKIIILLKLKNIPDASFYLYGKVLNFDKSKLSYLEARRTNYILSELNDEKRAAEYFDLAVKAAKTNSEKSSLYSMRASNHLNKNRFEDCVANYKYAISLDGKKAWDHGNLSICYQRLQKYDLAIQSAKDAIKIVDYGAAHLYLSNAYESKAHLAYYKKDFKEAEALYLQAALESPNFEIYFGLTQLYLTMKNEDKARAMADKSFEYGKDQPMDFLKMRVKSLFSQYKLEYN